jgi:serine/threonine protein kinase
VNVCAEILRRYSAAMLLLCLVPSLVGAAPRLRVGSSVQFSDESGPVTYTVVPPGRLGSGGFKTSYLIRREGCSRPDCTFVLGIYHDQIVENNLVPEDIPRVAELFTTERGVNLRREAAQVKARIDGVDHRVALSEYAPTRLKEFFSKLDGEQRLLGLAALAHDLYHAVRELDRVGYYHLDIKPENILVGGKANPTVDDVLEGRAYFLLADHDVLRPNGFVMEGAIVGTLDYLPPESFLPGRRQSSGSSVWEISHTLWEIFDRQHLYREKNFYIQSRIEPDSRFNIPLPNERVANAIRNYVSNRMSMTAESHRLRGQTPSSELVAWLSRIVLNGFHHDMSQRRLVFTQGDFDSSARSPEMLADLARRVAAWNGTQSCRSLRETIPRLRQ